MGEKGRIQFRQKKTTKEFEYLGKKDYNMIQSRLKSNFSRENMFIKCCLNVKTIPKT